MGQLARREHVFRYPSADPRVTARFELARTVNRTLRVVKLLAGLPMPRSTRDTDSPHDPGWDASMGDLGAGEVPAGQVGRAGRIPEMTVRRLSTYYRVVRSLETSGETEPLSSERMSELTGFSAAQVRRDLAYFGTFGKRGVGYPLGELQASLRSILGIDRAWTLALVGVGNLGAALLSYRNFSQQGFAIAGAFDVDPTKHGRRVGHLRVRPMSDLPSAVLEQQIALAIVAVPGDEAQDVVDQVVNAGIRGILNFAPVKVRVPTGIHVSRVDLSIEIEYLAYLLTNG